MNLKQKLVGRRFLQPLFEKLFSVSLRGMNYGLGGMIDTSGELAVIDLISTYMSQEPILFDVGANNGEYSHALRRRYPTSRIYAFEPSSYCWKNLKQEFDLDIKTFLVNKGLGSIPETRKLYFDEEASGWASVFQRDGSQFSKSLEKSQEISLTTLDTFCKENSISEIDFLKMDVEGFELDILKGAKSTLDHIKVIQFEFSFANFNSRTYLKEFFEILEKFSIYRVLQDGIYEIKYDPKYEILMTSNYLAINKKLNIKNP